MYRIENSKIALWKQTYLTIRFSEKTIKIWKKYLPHIGTLMKHCAVSNPRVHLVFLQKYIGTIMDHCAGSNPRVHHIFSKIYWYQNGPLCNVQSTARGASHFSSKIFWYPNGPLWSIQFTGFILFVFKIFSYPNGPMCIVQSMFFCEFSTVSCWYHSAKNSLWQVLQLAKSYITFS